MHCMVLYNTTYNEQHVSAKCTKGHEHIRSGCYGDLEFRVERTKLITVATPGSHRNGSRRMQCKWIRRCLREATLFVLGQEASSSYSSMLLLNTLQTPFPLRLLHPVLRQEHYSSIILYPWINSSASNALSGTLRPPQRRQVRRNFFLPMYYMLHRIIDVV